MMQPRDTSYDEIAIVIGEPNEMSRQNMNSMLRSKGIRQLRSVGSIESVREAIAEGMVDVVVLSDSMGEDAFKCIEDVRHGRLGKNPYAIITVMVDADNEDGLKKARNAGADDVMIKPIAPAQIVDRAKKVAFSRNHFVATTEYIGPNRRSTPRESPGQVVGVFCTMKVKLEGKTVTDEMVQSAVAATKKAIQSAQLDNQGKRLGTVCDRILTAYETKQIDDELLDNLEILIQCLEEASEAAKKVGQGDLADICHQFAREMEDLMEFYETPSDRSLQLIRTLTKAFQMARQSAATRTAG